MSEYLMMSMMLFVVYMLTFLIYVPIDKKVIKESEEYLGLQIPKSKYRYVLGIIAAILMCMIPYVRFWFVVISILTVGLLSIKKFRRLALTGQLECKS
jgi:hypothetical protein